jgi:N6-adenosine-specific RNA methylase IME4
MNDMDKYNTFYVDPPQLEGKWGPERLKQLPIREWCASDAVAFLWCRPEDLLTYVSVLRVWDFRYAYLVTWMKQTEEAMRWQSFECEYMLVGVRGASRPMRSLKENGFVLPAEEGRVQVHPIFFRDLAAVAAEDMYNKPALLDVFGVYWCWMCAAYDRDIWDFGKGVEEVDG